MKYKKRCQRLQRKQEIWDRESKDAKVASSTKRPGSTKKC